MKKNTVSLATAKKWAKLWRREESTYNKHHECRAFNIPLEDLKEVISEGAVSVKAYIGVEGKEVEGERVYIEKLLIVGVNAEGKDMISSKDGENLDGDSGDIYDFTEPCPETCDNTSPLNG